MVDTAIFSMGTHWLWHLFGGIAVHFLIAYIYQDQKAVRAKKFEMRVVK